MIIEKAQQLGQALSETAEFRRMIEAKNTMDTNASIQDMMKHYTQKRDAIVEMVEADQTDKEEMMHLSRQMDEIQSALMTDPVFVEMIEAQQAFQALMQQVNKTIAAYIGVDEPQSDEFSGGCAGSCSSCAGCKH